jgi:hypothetical protein
MKKKNREREREREKKEGERMLQFVKMVEMEVM